MWEGVRLYVNVDVIAPLKIRKVLFSHESLKKLSSKILIQSPTSLKSLQCFLNPIVDLSRYPLSAPYQLPPASLPVLPGQPRLSTPATNCVLRMEGGDGRSWGGGGASEREEEGGRRMEGGVK